MTICHSSREEREGERKRRKKRRLPMISVWALINLRTKTFGMKLRTEDLAKEEGAENNELITTSPKNSLRRKSSMNLMISSTLVINKDTMLLEMTQKEQITKLTLL
jgi:hypothetical protein